MPFENDVSFSEVCHHTRLSKGSNVAIWDFSELLSTLTNYQFAIVDCGRGLKPQGGAFRRERTHTFTYKSKFKGKYACANVFIYV